MQISTNNIINKCLLLSNSKPTNSLDALRRISYNNRMVIKLTASHDTTSTNHAIIRHMRTFLNLASVSYPHFVIKKNLKFK